MPCYVKRRNRISVAYLCQMVRHLCRKIHSCHTQITMSSASFNGPCLKKGLTTIAILFIGMLIGIFINRYGFIFEEIKVNVNLNISDLPLEYRNQSHQAILARIKRGVVNHTQFVVPNIVHFVWFGENRKLSFVNYVSILSAKKIQKPDKLLLHCDHLPVGPWWEKLRKAIPDMIISHREAPTSIHNQTLLHKYHKGDVAKMEILMKHGGIYLDTDVIVLNSMDPLRHYEMTMGKEKGPKLIAGIIVAAKKALFLKIWYESYRNNYRWDWDYNCARVTYQLYKQRPHLLNVERYKLTTPDWQDRHLLWKENIDWSPLYVIHIMQHMNFFTYEPEDIKALDCTFGQIMRYIYYGSTNMIKDARK